MTFESTLPLGEPDLMRVSGFQRYLDELADGATTEPVVRALLERSVRRLEQLCAVMLHRSYPRLTHADILAAQRFAANYMQDWIEVSDRTAGPQGAASG